MYSTVHCTRSYNSKKRMIFDQISFANEFQFGEKSSLFSFQFILIALSTLPNQGPKQTEKHRRINSELTNKSSRIDDLNQNRPITLLNSTLS